jgi:hypothetical protein
MMQLSKRTAAAVAAGAVALAVAGCGKAETFNNEAASDEGPSRLEQVKGRDLPRVVLTAKAAQRIGIETSIVRHAARPAHSGLRDPEVIPYAAVVYDAEGHAFAYVTARRLTFERTPISIVRTDGPFAVISKGPPAGTPVVTVGAQELLGVEYGVEED